MGSRSGSKVSTSVRPLCLLLLLHACSEAEQPPAQPPVVKAEAPRPRVEAPAPPAKQPEPVPDQEQGAAAVLQRYFALIEARQFAAAHKLREGGPRAASAAAFAAAYATYAEHHATVGAPSLVAEAGEWLYVDVPVQRYGTFRDGKTFANAGTVTLRRRRNGGSWLIFTSG